MTMKKKRNEIKQNWEASEKSRKQKEWDEYQIDRKHLMEDREKFGGEVLMADMEKSVNDWIKEVTLLQVRDPRTREVLAKGLKLQKELQGKFGTANEKERAEIRLLLAKLNREISMSRLY